MIEMLPVPHGMSEYQRFNSTLLQSIADSVGISYKQLTKEYKTLNSPRFPQRTIKSVDPVRRPE